MNRSELLKNWTRDVLQSRRDITTVAWHEVPGKDAPQESAPLGYGMRFLPVKSELECAVPDRRQCSAIGSYRTLWDGFIASLFPGTPCQAEIGRAHV